MNFSEIYIRRPVMTTLVMLGILIFGIMAYRLLPVSDLPNVDFPTIVVSASLPGASPETMASAVATPLERQFSTIAGIDSMTSSSTQGNTQITLQFNLNRDIDAAAQDVQSAISRTVRQLPSDMPNPPSYQKSNPADQPVLYLVLTSPVLSLSSLNEYGETIMSQRISMVEGVAQVQVFGSQKYAVRIQLDPRKLANMGIGLDEVTSAIQTANVNLPTGTLYGNYKAFTVEANGQLMNAEAYKPIIITYRNGIPVRLKDLGDVIDHVENNKVAAWYCTPEKQQRGIILAIQKQPGVNTVEVTNAVKALLPHFREQLPASVDLHILIDKSVTIKESADDVQFTLLLTLGLVVLVIFIFLRNLSATIIPSLALPMSIVGTFTGMYFLNYSLNNLSLMAITLAVGFVVDDAIVMLENIVRHVEMGKTPLQAALDGSKEINFTIISMTISLAAVFIPVIFMGGLIGRLFREFAVTIGLAVMISGYISLSLTPMLASKFLRAGKVQHGWMYRASESIFNAILWIYSWSLKIVLRQRFLTMIFSFGILVAMVHLFQIIPKGFLAGEDQGTIMIQTEGLEGISYKAMIQNQQALASILQEDTNIEAFMSSAGARGGSSGNVGRLMVRLKPRTERQLNADEIILQLRPKLSTLPGIRVFLQNPPVIQLGGRMSRSLYQFTLQTPDTDILYPNAAKFYEELKQFPEFLDVSSDLQLKNPQVLVDIDRDKASSLGVTVSQIESMLYNAYGSRQISTIFAPNNSYAVIMELKSEYQLNPDALSLLYVRSNTGKLIPLKSVAKLKPKIGPLSINHSGQLPSVTISFNLKPGTALGDAVNKINDLAKKIVPSSINTNFQGTAQAFQSSFQGLGLLLALAVLVIYLILGILYESFIHPITILSALPFAGFGALITLLYYQTELALYPFIGIIMLIGLVKKNGIMMIDVALELQQKENKTPHDAIFEACILRFRPIMMTTMAALMGALPIAFGYGAGAESRRPLGLVVVGGLLFSQSLTLYVTPVFYLCMESLRKIGRSKQQENISK